MKIVGFSPDDVSAREQNRRKYRNEIAVRHGIISGREKALRFEARLPQIVEQIKALPGSVESAKHPLTGKLVHPVAPSTHVILFTGHHASLKGKAPSRAQRVQTPPRPKKIGGDSPAMDAVSSYSKASQSSEMQAALSAERKFCQLVTVDTHGMSRDEKRRHYRELYNARKARKELY